MAVPARNQTARVLCNNFIAHCGFSARLYSDKVIKYLCKVAGINKTWTTLYHPMENGQAEPFNLTLLQMLGTCTMEPSKKSDWKSYVLPLVHAYECNQA